MPLSPGQILNNRYQIVRLLGQGGFGAVYRVWDMNMECPRALKENLDASPEAERQFRREAKILGELAHPNLPHVIDHFILPGQGQYLVMDFVEGEDLEKMLTRTGGPLPEQKVLSWIIQVCDALDYLHSRIPPIIHRDIKPANIRITPQGKAMLVDFGIAKIYDPQLKTTIGAQAITPGYSPNEQYGKGGRTDARTDVYALGATMYHLLTGQEPVETPERVLGTALPSLRQLNPAISPDVEQAVLKAMKILPQNRWQSAKEFREALCLQPSAFDPQPSIPIPLSARGRNVAVPTSRVASRALTWWRLRAEWVLGLILVILAVFVVVLLLVSGKETPPLVSKTEAVMILPSETINLQSSNPSPSMSPPVEVTSLANPSPSFPASTGIVGMATVTTSPYATNVGPVLATAAALYATLTSNAVLYASTLTSRDILPPVVPTTEAPPEPTILAADFTDEHGVHMKLIPAGEFEMGGNADVAVEECTKMCGKSCGCYPSDFENEEPVHTVYLDAFYMDIYEVTNALYALCVETSVCTAPPDKRSYIRQHYYGNPSYKDYPVYVSWNQASEYCEWRETKLPTEAEWEKAARGGLEGKLYPWGDQAPDCSRANYWKNPLDFENGGCVGESSKVGSYEPNGYGLFDMAGNVWEFVLDCYNSDYYSISPDRNPPGPSCTDNWLVRGGSWYLDGDLMRVASRSRRDGNVRQGFRCARSASTIISTPIPATTPAP